MVISAPQREVVFSVSGNGACCKTGSGKARDPVIGGVMENGRSFFTSARLPKKGEEIWYFKTPWGALMEILWRPERLGYEKNTANRIFQPHDKWPQLN